MRSSIATMFLLGAALAGCGTAPQEQPKLAGAKIGGPFTLVNQDGKTVRDTDFAGKYRLVYFGYTYCPDVCPTDLQRTTQALALLDKSDPHASARIVPLFISVDPERDTPARLKEFVSNFRPGLVGLTGSAETIAAVAKEYAVSYARQPAGPGGGYLVDHMAITYLMDPDGKPITFFTHDMAPDAVAAELAKWVR